MKKCSLGKGTMLTASFRRSAFSWPGNLGGRGRRRGRRRRKNENGKEKEKKEQEKEEAEKEKEVCYLRQVVTPDMVSETRWLRSP